MWDFLKDLRDSKDPDDVLALDIVRALVIYHGVLWMSELPKSLSNLRRGALPYIMTGEGVLRALKRLEEKGLVSLERRIRGKALSPSTYEDIYITLTDQVRANKELKDDPLIASYRYRVSKILKDLFNNKSV